MSQSSQPATIDVTKIIPNEVALRAVDTSSAKFLELTDSIKANGVMNSISVYKNDDGTYTLIDGLHRFTASKMAGLPTIPCLVYEKMTESEVLSRQLEANFHRVETRPAEYAKQLQRMLNIDVKLTMGDLAKKLNVSPEWLNARLRLANNLTEDVQKMVDSGVISISHGIAISKLPDEEQETWADAARTKPIDQFLSDVNAHLAEMRKKAKTGEPVEFSPTAHLRKFTVITSEQVSGAAREELLTTIPTPSSASDALVAGWNAALAWVTSTDAKSVAEQKQAWELRKQQQAERKEKAKAEREAKKSTGSARATRELALYREGKSADEVDLILAAEFPES